MIARTGVRKGVTGEGAAYDPESKGLLTVFDMEKKGFRMIPCEGVIKVTAQKQHHEFG